MIIPQHPFSVKVNQIHQTPHALRKQLFLSIVCYRIYANLSTKNGTMSEVWQRKSLIILFVHSMPWGINQLCANLWRKMKNKIQSISTVYLRIWKSVTDFIFMSQDRKLFLHWRWQGIWVGKVHGGLNLCFSRQMSSG